MSTLRFAQRNSVVGRPDGGWSCRVCGQACAGRRRSYCSDACAEAYAIRNFPSFARQKVKARDLGVCAGCGLDTLALGKAWRRREIAIHKRYGYAGQQLRRLRGRTSGRFSQDPEFLQLTQEKARYFGPLATGSRHARFRISLWDMDHTLPVVDGGGQCGLDNLQTLCVPCHRAKTASMARDRARNRRAATHLSVSLRG